MDKNELPTLSFKTRASLRSWLKKHHATSSGIWLHIYKKHSGTQSMLFDDALDEGLCFGLSESSRIRPRASITSRPNPLTADALGGE